MSSGRANRIERFKRFSLTWPRFGGRLWEMADPSPATRKKVLKRDKHECVFCGAKTDLSCDHVKDRKWGGSNHHGNLRTMCWPCHRFRNDFQLRFEFWLVLADTLSLTKAKYSVIGGYKCSCPSCRNTRSPRKPYCRACARRGLTCLVNRTTDPSATNQS